MKVDLGKVGGGGSAEVDYKIPFFIIIYFAEVDKGGGVKTLIHQKWIICFFMLNPFLTFH